jgi:hypothetical protein
MKKMKVLYYLLIASVSLSIMFSCTEEEIAKYKELDFSLVMVGSPDSLLTREQLRTKYKYHEICDKYMDIAEDGRLLFRISEEEWPATGLPKSYYDIVIRDFNSVNRYVSAMTDDTLKNRTIKSFHKALADYRQGWRERYAKVKHQIED